MSVTCGVQPEQSKLPVPIHDTKAHDRHARHDRQDGTAARAGRAGQAGQAGRAWQGLTAARYPPNKFIPILRHHSIHTSNFRSYCFWTISMHALQQQYAAQQPRFGNFQQ